MIEPNEIDESTTVIDYKVLEKLSKDVKLAAKTLGRRQARYLVNTYYILQKNRIRAIRQAEILQEMKEPNLMIDWIGRQHEILERNLKAVLGVYSQNNPIGQWAESICGIGPVISAGLLSAIDMQKAPTAGHIWRYAGLDPTVRWIGGEKSKKFVNEVWKEVSEEVGDNPVEDEDTELTSDPMAEEDDGFTAAFLSRLSNRLELPFDYVQRRGLLGEKGETLDHASKKSYISGLARRPWNAQLKRLCWIIGECFVKVSANKKDYYGKIWRQRSDMETLNNERFMYRDQAERSLREKNFDKKTDAYKAYIQGKLPKARIHERAKRYAVKLFLSHWHWVAYEVTFKQKPPKPYVIEHLGHAELLTPPNWTPIV